MQKKKRTSLHNRSGLIKLLATCCALLALLLAYWLAPDIADGLRAKSWPAAKGQLLSVGKGVWSDGGHYGYTPKHPIGSYSGGYYGVRIQYHYTVPSATGEHRPYSGWRYDAASSSRAFIALPGMGFPRSRWQGIHPGLPFTYAAIAHELPDRDNKLQVYYDPDNPQHSMLQPGIAADTAVLLILCCSAFILAFMLWQNAVQPMSNHVRDMRIMRTVTLAGLVILLYPVLSLLLAITIHLVIPSAFLLAYLIIGLIWIFFPKSLQRMIAVIQLPQALQHALAKTIVGCCILIALGGQVAGWLGWHIYDDIVPSYQPDKTLVLDTLAGDDPSLYPWAVYALVQQGVEKSHLPRLVSLLTKEDENTLRAILYALKQLGPAAADALPSIVALLPRYPEAIYTLKEIEPKPCTAIPALATLLENEQADIRGHALSLLSICGPRAATALPQLMQLLHSSDTGTRAATLTTLGLIGADETLEPIIHKLQDEDTVVRQHAAEALAYYGPRAQIAIPALEQLLNDNDKWVKKQAAEALRRIKR